ncbi:alpha/beta hydrolase [Hahella sp. KA22]|uniref:dienelactone hydrolase family protein n=1 Tax=Hahella sp. KA22 TaxID=1628392 RepID=UPI000FDE3BB7|nr:alpha/beta hydrolase [Hahella sp. KA22]AZZ92051.1 alpha/beta hydrolase [Hahella sp. KA22]QAY55422.1 alpha/beta hydrolase [Hahella sp. KA22]
MKLSRFLFAMLYAYAVLSLQAEAKTPQGEVKGHASAHDAASSRKAISNAQIALPGSVTGGDIYLGLLKNAPKLLDKKVPVVVFLHGSSGLGLQAIGQWQQWLAGQGIASLAPDSFALPDRLTYKSPVGKDIYEKIHALRSSEINLAVQALKTIPWADNQRLALAGASEGSVAVARYSGEAFAGRIIFSWSCENNYFVASPDTAVLDGRPIINVISASDPYFSSANEWLGNTSAKGNCIEAFKGHANASVVLIPDAPHTLLNLPMARQPVAAFLENLFRL